MQRKGILPDEVTHTCILKACAAIGSIDKGKKVHDEISIQGPLDHDIVLGNALVAMYAKRYMLISRGGDSSETILRLATLTYAKFGLLAEAKQVLEMLFTRDVVTWTALISRYANLWPGEEAFECFNQMHSEGVAPDDVTFVCILKACGSACVIDKGEQIHAEIEWRGLLERNLFVGRTLVDMYVKCSLVARARQVFERLPVRDLVSWTSLIAGYAEHGPSQEAVKCFERMQLEGVSSQMLSHLSAA